MVYSSANLCAIRDFIDCITSIGCKYPQSFPNGFKLNIRRKAFKAISHVGPSI